MTTINAKFFYYTIILLFDVVNIVNDMILSFDVIVDDVVNDVVNVDFDADADVDVDVNIVNYIVV